MLDRPCRLLSAFAAKGAMGAAGGERAGKVPAAGPSSRRRRAGGCQCNGKGDTDPIPYALETDWAVGTAGFEPLHLEIGSAELHPASRGSRRRSGAPLIRDAQVRVPPPGLRVLANSDSNMQTRTESRSGQRKVTLSSSRPAVADTYAPPPLVRPATSLNQSTNTPCSGSRHELRAAVPAGSPDRGPILGGMKAGGLLCQSAVRYRYVPVTVAIPND
jgi:hypothetical protein